MGFKTEIKKTFTGPDKLRGGCSGGLDDCFLGENVRGGAGEKGVFVSLPSRRNARGGGGGHGSPRTKDRGAKLPAAVLEAYEAAVQNEEAAVSCSPAIFQSLSGAAERRPQKGGGC